MASKSLRQDVLVALSLLSVVLIASVESRCPQPKMVCKKLCTDKTKIWTTCKNCQATCQTLDEFNEDHCIDTLHGGGYGYGKQACATGCICNSDEGYVLEAEGGQCIKKEQCPCPADMDGVDVADFVPVAPRTVPGVNVIDKTVTPTGLVDGVTANSACDRECPPGWECDGTIGKCKLTDYCRNKYTAPPRSFDCSIPRAALDKEGCPYKEFAGCTQSAACPVANMEWVPCGDICPKMCDDQNPVPIPKLNRYCNTPLIPCRADSVNMCQCKSGYYMTRDYRCVLHAQCPGVIRF